MEITSRYSIDIEDINRKCAENVYKLISRGEDAYNDEIKNIVTRIQNDKTRVILISGPSSSGKTTSSLKIKKLLGKANIKALVVNMDDFFKDLSTVPLREDGKPDMEGIVALDVKKLQSCLNSLLETGEAIFPTFDFATHKPAKKTNKKHLNKGEVIIMEGIHALNPQISKGLNIDKNSILRIYVHCNMNFTYKDKILFFARELRLLRRLVRDARERGCSYEKTLGLWGDVCRGEEKNIRPFKHTADYLLNTTHFYEPLLYKDMLLESFLNNENETIKMFIEKFKICSTIQKEFIPKDSLIREFIGKEE